MTTPLPRLFFATNITIYSSGNIGPIAWDDIGLPEAHGFSESVCPAPVVFAQGSPGTVTRLKLPNFSLRAFSGELAGFNGGLPQFSFVSYTGAVAKTRLPAPMLSASGVSVNVGKSVLEISAGTLLASGYGGGLATSYPTLAGHYGLLSYTGARAMMAMPAYSSTSGGASGGVGAFKGKLLFSAVASGGTLNTGSVVAGMPMLRAVPSGVVRISGAAFGMYSHGRLIAPVTYSGYSFNLLSKVDKNPQNQYDPQIPEATHFTNFAFSQIVRFGEDYYGAKEDGLYKLGGDTDEGAPIPWAFRLSVNDNGGSNLKRIKSVYIAGRLHSQAQVTLVVGEKEDLTYTYVTPRDASAQTYRVKFGQGVRTRYYSVEIADTAGGNISIDSVELEEILLDRKI
jgi:hypothetical protein